jgi:hypothetical protein
MISPTLVAIARDRCDRHVVTLRELAADDLSAVDALRARVLTSLANADHYVAHEHEAAFVRSHLGTAGFSIGIEAGSGMVGYSALSLDIARAELDPELEHAISGWCEKRNRPVTECCVLAVSMIAPAWTGLGLHRAAIDVRLRAARMLGRTIAFAIVSPVNWKALSNLRRSGMRIEDSLRFADGRVRHFLVGSTDFVPLPGSSNA